MRRFDLRSLHFDESGETWRRLPVEVEPFVFGGLDYVVQDGAADLLLSAGRAGESVTLVGEVEAHVTGPCQRCLGDADIVVCARSIEYVQSRRLPDGRRCGGRLRGRQHRRPRALDSRSHRRRAFGEAARAARTALVSAPPAEQT